MITRLLPLLLLAPLLSAAEFKVEGNAFVLDGARFQIRSGEIHYPRVPREEWRNRVRMARAMGLNTVCTYVFWNLHEERRGEPDFAGEKDVAEFVKVCGEEGMKVIVRPGPYVCAEWDLGGLPAWLLAEPGMRLRSSADARFMEAARGWMRRMGAMWGPLSVARGGPVLMVQVENEFGNFGGDAAYLEAMRDALREGGWDGLAFTGDGASGTALRRGGLPGVTRAVNFGQGAEKSFGLLRKAAPGQPDFTAEFWVGWFDQWQRPRSPVNPMGKLADLEWMMREGASFNLYMFHGGSTRGLWTGANTGTHYLPTVCSYDYRAPLDESGRPTGLYGAMRKVMRKRSTEHLSHFCQRSGGYGIYATRLSMV